MTATVNDADRGCRDVLIWLGIITTTFLVCVAIGIAVFAMNIREHGGNAVREDLFSLIDTAEMPEGDKVALRVRVDNLVKAYQDEQLTQEDFLAQSIALREDLLTKQPAPPEAIDPARGVPSNPAP